MTLPAPVALTFDDGPYSPYTEEILAILAQRHIPATFFCMGERVERRPDLVQAMVDSRHTIANHTWSHAHLPALTLEQAQKEIERGAQAVWEVTGLYPRLFRPPYGEVNAPVARLIAELDSENVLWDVDPRDWATPPAEEIVDQVETFTQAGSIILLHTSDSATNTPRALPGIIDALTQRGFSFVRLEDLLQCAPYR